ncbi:MAG TPA: protein kinase [Gemmatimonadales bacterium]|nr:protein kinase [Gemmatimonadales bacterium]
MTDPVAELREGLRDRYAFERELGRGGMATVFLARDLKHDRPVALKALHPELASTLGPDRFQREIRLAARLQHPHILTVLDSGTVGERLWFTMPFVDGESLRDRLRRERQLPVDDALRIAREAAQALQYAHDQGVIHRDIKPENLLLTRDGNTLVADFGIARALGAAGDDRLTETGLAIGTPAYMSPEQAAGDKGLDARTDVYSLAAVLYEMLAGEAPYTGATTQALIVKRLTEPPPSIRSVRSNVPEATDAAIRKALAPVPADRFASVAEFARALQEGSARTVAAPASPTGEATRLDRVARPRARAPVFRRSAAILVLGFVLGLGVLFGWLHRRGPEPGAAGVKTLAVLPFENLGRRDDEYFADGVTDAVRGKLTSLAGLQVTASNSSAEYKRSTKSPQQIARDLGVAYLLVGKVRWEKSPDGSSRVQVSPELIQASSGAAKWQQPFDATITDVFQVQADIAGKVAQALDVALGTTERQALTRKPTADLGAYDAFLKGEEIADRLRADESSRLRDAITYYEQAVALDSGFVGAWAQLSRAHSLLYFRGSTSDAPASLGAAQRATALAPNAVETHLAMGDYYNYVALDFRKSVEQYTAGLKLAPTNADLVISLARSEQSLGRSDSALAHFRQSVALDPRSPLAQRRLGRTLLWLRRYPEAREVSERGQALAPNDLSFLQTAVMVELGQGHLDSARALLSAYHAVEPTTLVAYFANYWDLYWALTPAQQDLLLRLTPRPFDDNRGAWGIALASTYALRGDQARARAYADSAQQAFEAALVSAPDNSQIHALLGVALAYMGRKDEAIREAQRSLELLSIAKDAYGGPYSQLQLVRIYTIIGETDKAMDQLEPLLRMSFYVSPGWLRVDPNFDPLRKNPRFRKLVGEG